MKKSEFFQEGTFTEDYTLDNEFLEKAYKVLKNVQTLFARAGLPKGTKPAPLVMNSFLVASLLNAKDCSKLSEVLAVTREIRKARKAQINSKIFDFRSKTLLNVGEDYLKERIKKAISLNRSLKNVLRELKRAEVVQRLNEIRKGYGA